MSISAILFNFSPLTITTRPLSSIARDAKAVLKRQLASEIPRVNSYGCTRRAVEVQLADLDREASGIRTKLRERPTTA